MASSVKMLRSVLVVIALTLVPFAFAVPTRYETVDYPGATQTFVWGVNASGEIVGSFVDSSSKEHGYVLRDGTFTAIDVAGAAWTQAYSITLGGDIVGQYGIPGDNTTHGFRLSGGAITPIDIAGPTELGRSSTMPFATMPDGTIVGCYHQTPTSGGIAPGSMHGFVLNAAGVSYTPSGNMMNTAVNAAGEIVGYGTGYSTDPAATDRGYLLHNNAATWFSVPGSMATRPRGISARGDIVGIYQDGVAKKFHGFLYREGTFATLDAPGATATRPTAMNASGDIVGYYTDAKGNHGFLLRNAGWWWNPDKPGTGFLLERQGTRMFVLALVYSYDGTPTWLTSGGPFANGAFAQPAHTYRDGQTLTGPFRQVQDDGPQGLLEIRFTDGGTAEMQWTANLYMSTTFTLQRFGFTGGPGFAGAVDNGLWWSPAEPGRAFILEVQDGSIFVAGAMYDEAGRPTWYLSVGPMTEAMQYSGSWTQYGMGPTMLNIGGAPSVVNPNAGRVQLKFADAQNGFLTLPDGRQITVTRYAF